MPIKEWSDARTLADLGEVAARWLLGRLPAHPIYNGPPDHETTIIRRALIRFNRRGYVTDFSQPGVPVRDGCGQRAALSGFCSAEVAMQLARLTLCSDLMVLAYPPGEVGGYQVPITSEYYHPFTWCGRCHGEEVERFEGLHEDALNALGASWYVVVIDPRWGRSRYLWRQVKRALEQGIPDFRELPAPGLELDTEFAW